MTFRFATGELRLKPLGTVQDITQASTAGLSLGQDFKLIETEPNGPAANAGLLAGDEILEFGGRPLKTMKMEDIIALKRLPPGTVLKVRYRRGESKPEETKMILEKQK
jgi:C-terminal processing protease CtpA/Prc